MPDKQCRWCSSMIPRGQSICPACYSAVDASRRTVRSAELPRRHVMLFLASKAESEKYVNRLLKYMPERLAGVWYAETPGALVEMTEKSSGLWGLLIVSPSIAKENRVLLRRFAQQNPGLVVGVEYAQRSAIPRTPVLEGATAFRKPSGTDRWLLAVGRLLDEVGHS